MEPFKAFAAFQVNPTCTKLKYQNMLYTAL